MKYPPSSDESLLETLNQSSAEGIGSDPHPTEQMPVKVCRRCSIQSETTGNFCPQCAAPYNGPGPRRKISKRIVIGVVTALVLAGSATGLALKVSHDNQVTASAIAAKSSAQAVADAAAAQQVSDDKTRTDRQTQVTSLEASILKDAKERVKTQALTGPILRASCTPLGGGSADDLTALTGTFECIAVNKENADGTSSGYRFAATINWNKDYTWHLGS
jgi:hypothetical protein